MRDKSIKLPCQCEGCIGIYGTKNRCRKSIREMNESIRGYNEIDYPTSNRHESRNYIKAKIINSTATQLEKNRFQTFITKHLGDKQVPRKIYNSQEFKNDISSSTNLDGNILKTAFFRILKRHMGINEQLEPSSRRLRRSIVHTPSNCINSFILNTTTQEQKKRLERFIKKHRGDTPVLDEIYNSQKFKNDIFSSTNSDGNILKSAFFRILKRHIRETEQKRHIRE